MMGKQDTLAPYILYIYMYIAIQYICPVKTDSQAVCKYALHQAVKKYTVHQLPFAAVINEYLPYGLPREYMEICLARCVRHFVMGGRVV